jgi:hypothetical protein
LLNGRCGFSGLSRQQACNAEDAGAAADQQ